MSSITIRCANGEEVDVDLEVAKQVPVIESALRHSSDEATSMEWPVDSATFHLIFDWCAYHKVRSDTPILRHTRHSNLPD